MSIHMILVVQNGWREMVLMIFVIFVNLLSYVLYAVILRSTYTVSSVSLRSFGVFVFMIILYYCFSNCVGWVPE